MRLADLHELGIQIDAAAFERLVRFVPLLLSENEKLNLTAIRTPEGVWLRHIVDSLAALPLIDAAAGECESPDSHSRDCKPPDSYNGECESPDSHKRDCEPPDSHNGECESPDSHNRNCEPPGSQLLEVVDLGSGGGVPGLPLACARPDMHFALIDSTGKKMAAVERMIAELGLANARTVTGRAEELAHKPQYRERFDFLVARAVGPLAPLVEWAAGLVKPEGQCCFYKALTNLEAEIRAAEPAARACKLDYDATLVYSLPGELGERALVTFTKVDRLPRDLPRPPWLAKGRPL